MIRIAIRAGLTYWALYIIFKRYRDLLAGLDLNPGARNNSGLTSASADALPAFASPRTISIASYVISFGLALLLIVVAWKAYTLWKEINASNSEQPVKKIAKIVRSSLDDLSSGRNSTDVIINCYFRMSDVVANKRKIHRGAAITPAEFAFQLEGAGLPANAVQ